MICEPCKEQTHTGTGPWALSKRVKRLAPGVILVAGLKVCKGGTWCDCQHRVLPGRTPR
jgi:hypothetical protein